MTVRFSPNGQYVVYTSSESGQDEIYAAPQSWAVSAYPKLIHYNKLPKGGHFAAWEQPQFLTEELRVSFRQFR